MSTVNFYAYARAMKIKLSYIVLRWYGKPCNPHYDEKDIQISKSTLPWLPVRGAHICISTGSS